MNAAIGPGGVSPGEPVKAGELEQSGRLEVGADLHDLVVGVTEAYPVA